MNETLHLTQNATQNLAVLRGIVAADPVQRDLPGGGSVAQFDVVTRVDDRSVPAPVAWYDAADAQLPPEGTEVVVVGAVKRRFFRVGGSTQSRTEVVAEAVIPARRRRQVQAALDGALARIS